MHGRAHAAEADISVVVGSGPWNGLVAHPLFAQTMVPACSPELLAERPVLRYEDLNAHTLLVHEARRDDWDRWASAVGMKNLQPAQIVRIDSMSAATRAAEKKHRHRAAARRAVAPQVRAGPPDARVR